MHRLRCTMLGFLTLLLIQEMVPQVDAARVRVVKVKKTRHDKRQTPGRAGYSTEVIGQAYEDQNIKPEDNPYNAGNRKVDYPLLNPKNNQNRNFQQQSSQQSEQKFNQNQKRQQPAQRPQQPVLHHGSKNYDRGDEHCEGCGNGIPGVAGTDYPTYTALPKTNFECKKQQWPGYYADTEARCQVFWICQKNRADAFLCPNGTLFNQQVFVCDWWFNVDCGTAPEFYSRNQYIYAGPGVDLYGNQVQINNRQSTAVVSQVNRNRPPTNRPPLSTTFQQPHIEHASPTVIPINTFQNQRPTSFQASIPIIQTGQDQGQAQGSNYNRRATQSSPRVNKVYVSFTEKPHAVSKNDNNAEYQDENDYERQTSPPTTTGNIDAYNAEYDANEFLERTERKLEKSETRNLASDGGNSYANYIEAQKRLHLGANYKPPKGSATGSKGYQQNPLLSSSTLAILNSGRQQQQQRQSRTYQDDNYATKRSQSQYSQSQSKYSAYDSSQPSTSADDDSRPSVSEYSRSGASAYDSSRPSSGTGYSTTTKRNALSPEELEGTISDFPAAEDEKSLDDIDDLKFNFAKMLQPTTTPVPQVLKRPTEVEPRKLTHAPTGTPIRSDSGSAVRGNSKSSKYEMTTHRPFSRRISDAEQQGKSTGSALVVASSSYPQPRTYLQVPPPSKPDSDNLPTTPSTPTSFGKKIKSGKKRNTSNWTNYFHRN